LKAETFTALKSAALQSFADAILRRMIFDGEQPNSN
jgi:hypothetical protein